ncbi:MAG TPA: histidine kinase [Chryseolinea sp.]
MSNKHKIALSISFVIALLFTLPWATVIEQSRFGGFNEADSNPLARVVFMFLTVFAASLILFDYNFFWKRWSADKKPRYHIMITMAVNLLAVLLISIVCVAVASAIFHIKAVRTYFIFYLFRNLTIAVVVVLVSYVVELVERLRQEKIELLTLQRQNIETELAALKTQIDPHFLFNTLTTLSSLARANSKETISFIDHMADTFRYMLENRTQKVVTVKDELSFLQSYLFMMKKRFEEGFQVNIDVRDEHLARLIPQFALQTVFENAMHHNIVSAREPLRIELTCNHDSITVRNNLKAKKSSKGHGVGLDNLAQRYWLMGKKKIQVVKDENSFSITLPLL